MLAPSFSAIIAAMHSSRRRFLLSAGLAGCAVAGLATWRWWPEQGLVYPCLGELPPHLATHPLVVEALAGLDPAKVWDAHVHILAAGESANPANPTDFHEGHGNWPWPVAAAQRWVFLNAACIEDDSHVAHNYLARLQSLARLLPIGHKLLLLALDAWHDESGTAIPARTHLFIGNDDCAAAAAALPARFEWAASIHPYRADAVDQLAQVRLRGARAIKWIPAAQGIDPASPRCDNFYAQMARLGLPLITHAGEERAMPGDDRLGNPLKLRRALDRGVKVVMAHCASMGANQDLDRGADSSSMVDNFVLFERLMDEPSYFGLLFGDLSALTQSARAGAPLRRILERAGEGGDWAPRLLNGSDYPLPAIMPLYSPRQLVNAGYLDAAKLEPLGAIRRHHPLLFDFVLKRHLRLGGKGLAKAVFETRRLFDDGT